MAKYVGATRSPAHVPANGQSGGVCSADASTIDHGTECDLSCDSGYTLSGQPSCMGDSLSSVTAACTIQTCDVSVVTQPVNGQYGTICAAGSSTIDHGTQCDLTCDTGYEASGQPSCDQGVLTSRTAICSNIDDCGSQPCLNGGDCYDVISVACRLSFCQCP